MLRGHLDAAPFVTVFFLILIFVLLGTLVYTPGVQVKLPVAEDLPGSDEPSVSVAVDSQGQLYFENQLVDAELFIVQLKKKMTMDPERLTLIIQADRDVSYETLIRVTQLARQAGVQEALLATMPRLFSKGAAPSAVAP